MGKVNSQYVEGLINDIIDEINRSFIIMKIKRYFENIQKANITMKEKQEICNRIMKQIEKDFSLSSFCMNCISCPLLVGIKT